MHHFRLSFSEEAADGQAGYGAEYGGTRDTVFGHVYRALHQPRHLKLPQLHVINTRNPYEPWHGNTDSPGFAMQMCPCTEENRLRLRDTAMLTSDGLDKGDDPDAAKGGYGGPDVIYPVPYTGGLLCCTDGLSLIRNKSATCRRPDCSDLPVDRFYLKVTYYYEAVPVRSAVSTPRPLAEVMARPPAFARSPSGQCLARLVHSTRSWSVGKGFSQPQRVTPATGAACQAACARPARTRPATGAAQ